MFYATVEKNRRTLLSCRFFQNLQMYPVPQGTVHMGEHNVGETQQTNHSNMWLIEKYAYLDLDGFFCAKKSYIFMDTGS